MPALPRLIVITDWSMGERALLEAIESIVATHGPRVGVQQRNPGIGGREFLRQTRLVHDLCARHGSPLFVNGRLDVALLVDAHLHLPAHGPDVGDVRPHLPPGRWISVAVHDTAEAARARGADLALVSPVFGAGSKPGDRRTPLGSEGFAALANRLSCPAYALGGVQADRAARLRPFGIAAISGVLHADHPAAAARALLKAVSGAAQL
ncbi:MAG: thiamine phosphate synthase [Myxococcaceae bacterium]|nr:thiamine phosphate synthase [Myxococcaceae bacterium]